MLKQKTQKETSKMYLFNWINNINHSVKTTVRSNNKFILTRKQEKHQDRPYV